MIKKLVEIGVGLEKTAESVQNSTIILDNRDKQLQEELSCMLSLEGKSQDEIISFLNTRSRAVTNSFGLKFNHEQPLAASLNYPVDFLPIPSIGKNTLKRRFKCSDLEDVLSVMLIQQRENLLYNTNHIGKKSLTGMENYLVKLGILIIDKGNYSSPLCLSTYNN